MEISRVWNKYTVWRKSGRIQRWLFHPFISYLYRAHSFEVSKLKSENKIRKKRANLFFGQSMFVTLPEEVSSYIYRYQYFEPELTGALIKIVKPGMTFIDIGAHYGYFSRLASCLVSRGGNVISLEPVPSTFSILLENVSGCNNVTAIKMAAHTNTGKLKIRDYGTLNSSFNSFMRARSKEVNTHGYQEVLVDTISVDNLASQMGIKPHVVKIDAESTERDVLQGMLNIIQDTHPIITIEVGDEIQIDNVLSSHDLIEYVSQLGYVPYSFDGRDFVRHIVQPKYHYGNIIFFPHNS